MTRVQSNNLPMAGTNRVQVYEQWFQPNRIRVLRGAGRHRFVEQVCYVWWESLSFFPGVGCNSLCKAVESVIFGVIIEAKVVHTYH